VAGRQRRASVTTLAARIWPRLHFASRGRFATIRQFDSFTQKGCSMKLRLFEGSIGKIGLCLMVLWSAAIIYHGVFNWRNSASLAIKAELAAREKELSKRKNAERMQRIEELNVKLEERIGAWRKKLPATDIEEENDILQLERILRKLKRAGDEIREEQKADQQ